MYQPPTAELNREALRLSPRPLWLRLLLVCAFAVLGPVVAVFAAKHLGENHGTWSLVVALGSLPLGLWAFVAREHPRKLSRSAVILAGILLATAIAAFAGLFLAFPVGFMYHPNGALLPAPAGA